MGGSPKPPPPVVPPADPNEARRKAEAESAGKRIRAKGWSSSIISNQLGLKQTLGE